MKKKLLYTIAFAMLVLLQPSCKKAVEGYNVSPNNTTDASQNLLLTGVEASFLSFFEGDMARLGNIWSQAFTGADRQYTGFDDYSGIAASDFSNAWEQAYVRVNANGLILEKKATDLNNKILKGISQTLRAATLGTVTACWENVPFSEAGDVVAFPTPKFETQAAVYAAVQLLLDDAITNLTSGMGGVVPAAKDFFFGANAGRWTRVARTLKARYYLHVKDYANAHAQAVLGITSAAEDMLAPHGTTLAQDVNKYWSFIVRDRDSYMNAANAYTVKLMNPSSSLYRGNTKTDERARLRYHYVQGNSIYPSPIWVANTSAGAAYGQSSKFPLVTFSETKLIEAEAFARLSTPNFTNALAALNAHRAYMNTNAGYASAFASQGFMYSPYVAADFDPAGIENVSGSLTPINALIREIVEERYITLIGQIEHFNDMRRTKNAIGLTPVLGSSLPQRFLYPQSEINANPNTPSQAVTDLFVKTVANN